MVKFTCLVCPGCFDQKQLCYPTEVDKKPRLGKCSDLLGGLVDAYGSAKEGALLLTDFF
jgi:hypothetical protein